MNKKGFTLIELLAVIVIMGILMMVAVPAVNRYVEKSRKSTFVNTTKEYLNSARNLWYANEMICCNSGCDDASNYTIPSNSIENGTYSIRINTKDATDGNPKLLSSGGTSPWGKSNMFGYVQVTVTNGEADFKIAVNDQTDVGSTKHASFYTYRSLNELTVANLDSTPTGTAWRNKATKPFCNVK